MQDTQEPKEGGKREKPKERILCTKSPTEGAKHGDPKDPTEQGGQEVKGKMRFQDHERGDLTEEPVSCTQGPTRGAKHEVRTNLSN